LPQLTSANASVVESTTTMARANSLRMLINVHLLPVSPRRIRRQRPVTFSEISHDEGHRQPRCPNDGAEATDRGLSSVERGSPGPGHSGPKAGRTYGEAPPSVNQKVRADRRMAVA
jgi:hypothetical protein